MSGVRPHLEELLGRGGMGLVYRATHQVLGTDVAVKILALSGMTSEQDIERFQREARLGASLDHPNVVRVFHIGHTDEEYFLVMEYLAGQTLAERIVQRGPLPWREAVQILARAARGLGAALHPRGAGGAR